MPDIESHYRRLELALQQKREADTVIFEERAFLRNNIAAGLAEAGIRHDVHERVGPIPRSAVRRLIDLYVRRDRREEAERFVNQSAQVQHCHTFRRVS